MSQIEQALLLVQAKDIEITEGMARVNNSLITGTPKLETLAKQLDNGHLIEDLTDALEELCVLLPGGRGRLLRRIAVAYRALLIDLGVLLDRTIKRGVVPKKTYKDVSSNAVELIELIEDTKSNLWYLLASTDELTGLLNRQAMEQSFELAVMRSMKRGSNLGVALVDADHFKKINDTYGHSVGDIVLTELAKIITGSVRPQDVAIRYGGEEIAILLPNITNRTGRYALERIRKNIGGSEIKVDQGLRVPVSVSIGYTLRADTSDGLKQLLVRADKALYRAKERGRNRVEFEPAKEETL